MSLKQRFKVAVAPWPFAISTLFNYKGVLKVIKHHRECCQKCDLENGEMCEHYYEDHVQELGPIGRWFS